MLMFKKTLPQVLEKFRGLHTSELLRAAFCHLETHVRLSSTANSSAQARYSLLFEQRGDMFPLLLFGML